MTLSARSRFIKSALATVVFLAIAAIASPEWIFNPYTGKLDYYQVGTGGGGTPSGTVTNETDYGQSPSAGSSTDYSRGNHTHGTPTDSTPAHSILDTGTHGVGASTIASVANIETHGTVTHSTHNFDASGNAPAQAHDNARHSTAYLATSDTDYVYILQDVLKKLCSGLYTGGGLSIHAGATTLDIAAGTGVLNDHTGTHGTVSWSNLNVSPAGNGTNYVAIIANGIAVVSLTRFDQGTHIRLGHFFSQGGYILEAFSTPDWAQHFMGRVLEWIGGGVGSLVETGLGVSEQGTALKLSVSGGTFRAKLGAFTTGTITTFAKMYNSADMGWGQDSNSVNYVNVTQWNNITNNQASALVTMTAGYWKKDLVIVTPSGNVYYMFGQAEYSTEDLAKKGALPVLPPAIQEDGCYLAAIVCQKGDASIATRIWDIRPSLDRIFGYGTGTAGIVVDHATLTNLAYATSGHTGFADSAHGVTNGDTHDHAGGDGAQIAYGGLSGIPSTFAPTSHGNSAHTSTFITAADLPTLYNQTVQDEGTARTQRASINFVGSGVSCVDDTNRTTCTINGGSGSVAITQIEVDMGWPAVRDKTFTVSDAGVSAGMNIMASIAYEDNSTSTNSADEAIISEIHCSAGKAGTGTYTLFCSAPLPVGGKFKLNITKA